jgi:glycine betaine/proline transport system ATP-binding protein
MRSGRIVQIGTAQEILTEPANDYVAKFIADVDRSRVLTASSVMEPTSAVIPLSAGPHGAVNLMREKQVQGVLVVDRDRKLLGYVTDDDAVAAVKAGGTDLTTIMKTDQLIKVQVDTPVAELFAPAVDSPIPLAVVDEQDRLRGVVPRVGLLASMAQHQAGVSAA